MNDQNLIQNSGRSREEVERIRRKGGKKSVEVRREWATFKECFKDCMTPEDRKQLYGVLMSRAKAGNLKAFELLRDTLGEKPADELQVTDTGDLSVTIEVVE